MRKMIVLPAIALAFGCAMGGQEAKRSETLSAQDRANQQLQQAADAQKRAAGEQAAAEKDQQEVVQAQDDARRMSEQAQTEVQQEQKQASQFQEQQTQKNSELNKSHTQEWTAQKDLEGRVMQASGDEIQVRTSDQQLVKLDVTDSTSVNFNGRSGKISQVQPGSDVRASYQLIDGKAKALQIDVMPASGDKAAAQPQDQTATPPQGEPAPVK